MGKKVPARAGKVLSYFLFLVVLYLNFLFSYNYVSLIIFISFFLLCPVSIVMLCIYARNVEISCNVHTKQVEKGQPFSVRLGIKNPTWALVDGVRLQLNLNHSIAGKICSQEISVPVSMKGEDCVLVEVSSPFCGVITASIERVSLISVFGFMSVLEECSVTDQILVIPEIVPLDVRIEEPSSIGCIQQDASISDCSEVADVREYAAGDCYRDVHWKLSAARTGLLVKDYAKQGDRSITVLLEFPRDCLFEVAECVLELYLAVVDAVCKEYGFCTACYLEDEAVVGQEVTGAAEAAYQIFSPGAGTGTALDLYKTEKSPAGVLYVCDETVNQSSKIIVKRGGAVAAWL